MSLQELLRDGALTELGRQVALDMYSYQCDRRPCFACSYQIRQTGGPGGERCKAPQLVTRAEVDEVISAYTGKATGYDVHARVVDNIFTRLG